MERHWKTALHEAAHALYSLSVGVVPSSMSVEANGDGSVHAEFSAMAPLDRCTMAMIGASAVDILEDDPNHEGAFMSVADQQIYHEAAGDLGGNRVVIGREARASAEQFVRANAEGIRQVAAVLADKRTMGPAELAKVVHANPSLFRFRKLISKPAPSKSCACAASGNGCRTSKSVPTSWPAGRREFVRKNPQMRGMVEDMIQRGHLSR